MIVQIIYRPSSQLQRLFSLSHFFVNLHWLFISWLSSSYLHVLVIKVDVIHYFHAFRGLCFSCSDSWFQSLEVFVTDFYLTDLFFDREGSVDEVKDVFGEIVRIFNQKSWMNQSSIIQIINQLSAILIRLFLNTTKSTSTILFNDCTIGAWGLISRIFFSLWYLAVAFIDAAAYNLSRLGVSFIMSATMTTGSSTSLKDTRTSFILSFSWFWAYSIKGV